MEADPFSVLPLDKRYFNTSGGIGKKKGECFRSMANQTYLHVPAKLLPHIIAVA